MTMEHSTVLKMYDVSPIRKWVTFLLAMLSFQGNSSTLQYVRPVTFHATSTKDGSCPCIAGNRCPGLRGIFPSSNRGEENVQRITSGIAVGPPKVTSHTDRGRNVAPLNFFGGYNYNPQVKPMLYKALYRGEMNPGETPFMIRIMLFKEPVKYPY